MNNETMNETVVEGKSSTGKVIGAVLGVTAIGVGALMTYIFKKKKQNKVETEEVVENNESTED